MRRCISLLAFTLLAVSTAGIQGQQTCNPIVCENQLPGNPSSEWDISGSGDSSVQGFATDISVNKGDTVHFKVDTTAPSFRIDVYRLGYYAGLGARKIASLGTFDGLHQASCLTAPSTGLIDCGNWLESASWQVPANAVSGVYIARLSRTDTGGASHVVFIVRDDVVHADVLFQTSDTTWQAYNTYGGNSLYVESPGTNPNRAYKVSYNRPFTTRDTGPEDWLFNAEYPMIRWLEANGYNVSYVTGVDTDRFGATELFQHRVFLSVGHDEYWSGPQRTNVEAARNGGVNLAFFSGNEVFWKTRWESSIDGTGTPYRTLVSYKETHANATLDPADPPTWTGTWRDPRFSPPADGGRPENALTGTIFTVNCCSTTAAIRVAQSFAAQPFWRNTRVATLRPGESTTLTAGTLGYEWDENLNNGFRPAGLTPLSSTTLSVSQKLQDYGSTYASGTATHALTLYRHLSGALVFGAGTVQWSWGLDGNHDRGGSTPDLVMQQATVNLFADMGVSPFTLQAGLVSGMPDTAAPTVVLTAPSAGTTVGGRVVSVAATASDNVGIVGVQFKLDGVNLGSEATSSPYAVTWDPTSTANGPHILTAVARDAAGNQTTSVSVTTTVSNTVSLAVPAFVPVRINAGGAAFTDSSGNAWAADTNFSGGSTFNKTVAIAGTADDTLFQTERYGNFSYNIPVPNGTYAITLRFAEIYWTASGKRVFNVNVEGQPAISNLDIFAAAGANAALDRVVQATVTDGTLNIGFVSVVDNAKVSAIQVAAVTGVNQAPVVNAGADKSITLPTSSVSLTGTASDDGLPAPPGVLAYGWSMVSGPAGVTFNPSSALSTTASFTTAGSYTLRLTASDSALSTTDDVVVTVNNPDITPPTVSITAPANNATVSGSSVAISASASDNVAVGGVQFQLDGASLGAEDTTSLYSIVWDTTLVAPGSHVLGAVARDAAGNTTSAAVVTVTVAAAPAVLSVAPGAFTPTSAVVNWTTNVPSDSQVRYGVTTAYGSVTTLDSSLVTSHTQTVVGLTAGTLYHYQVVSRNAGGVTAASLDSTFTPQAGLVYADEFNAAALDTSTWQAMNRSGDSSNSELQYYLPQNAALTNGALSITSKVDTSVPGYNYTSEMIQWASKDVLYGTFEIRAKMPGGQGTWPALWLLGHNCHAWTGTLRDAPCNWPNSGSDEIDMTEILGSKLTSVNQQIHSGSNNTGCSASVTNVSQNWHTYQLVWAAGSLTWKIDGATTCVVTTGVPSTPMFLIIDTALGGAGGSVVDSTLPQTLLVDYVRYYSPDPIPPTVAITAPAAGASVNGSAVTVSASAADNVGVAGVQFMLDGVALGAEDTVAPYSITWNSTTATNGSHTLTAVARDAAKNVTTSTGIAVTVTNDTTPPTVMITAPLNGAAVSGTAVSVSADAADNVSVVGVQFTLDGVPLGAEDTIAPYAVTWNSKTSSNGSHTLTAVARDAAGNLATSAGATVTVSNDTTPPTVTLTAPSAGAIVSGTAVSVTADAADDVGVVGVQFRLDNASLGAEVTVAPYGIVWDTTASGNGSHAVTAVARDAAGNTATALATVTVNNPDVTPPTVTITAPLTNAVVSGSAVVVSANSGDNVGVVGVQFQLDGTSLGAEDTTSPYTILWDATTVAAGAHTLTATARDIAGNIAVATVNVTVVTPPAISGISAGLFTQMSAAINWMTNVATDSQVRYGLTAAYGSTTALDPSLLTSHSVILAGLSPGVLYHYQVVSRDASGTSVASQDSTFTPLAGLTFADEFNASVVDAAAWVLMNRTGDGSNNEQQYYLPGNATVQNGLLTITSKVDGSVPGYSYTSAMAQWQSFNILYGTLEIRAKFPGGTGTWPALWLLGSNCQNTNVISADNTPPCSWPNPGSDEIDMAEGLNSNLTSLNQQIHSGSNNPGCSASVTNVSQNWHTYQLVWTAGSMTWKIDGAVTCVVTTGVPSTPMFLMIDTALGGAGGSVVNSTLPQTFLVDYVRYYSPDTVAPTVSITAPADGASVTGSAVTVLANAADNVAVAGVQFTIDGVNAGAEDTAAPYSLTWNSTSASNGPHTLGAIARDAGGNKTTATVTVTVNNPPTISAVSVTSVAPTSVTIGWTTNVLADSRVDYGPTSDYGLSTIPDPTLGTSHSQIVTGLSPSTSYHFHVVSTDGSGNTAASQDATFSTANAPDTVAPAVLLTAPTAGATVTGTAVAVSANATDNVGVVGVQFKLDGVNLGAEDTVAPYGVTWNTTTANNGSHILTAVARDAAGNTTTSATVTVTVANASAGLAIGATAFGDQPSVGSKTVAASITTSANQLLLAFIAADDAKAGNTVSMVAGGGLTWQFVARTNAKRGLSEVWRTWAPASLSNASITATLAQAAASSMTIVAFTGADSTGTSGAGAIGAVKSASGTGAPTGTLTTTRNSSWVFAVGNDWDNPTQRTLGPNQTMVHQYLPPVGDTYWVQRMTAPTSATGTTVTVNDTAPTTDQYNLTIVEVLPK